jgi:hypothetical protein
MFANLDRNQFLALLAKLGSEDDKEVLAAARDLHAKVTVAGVRWEDLLTPNDDNDDPDASDAVGPLSGEDEGIVLVAPEADRGGLSDADKAEIANLIEAIGKMQISETTRDDLVDYKTDLAAGTLEQMDLKYLRGLAKRLSGK